MSASVTSRVIRIASSTGRAPSRLEPGAQILPGDIGHDIVQDAVGFTESCNGRMLGWDNRAAI